MALLTGLNVFAVTVMPDLFAGLMLLGVAMILSYAPRLPRWEYAFWLMLVLAACLFHKSHLLILAASVTVAAGFLWRSRLREILALAAVAALAVAGHYAVDLAVESHRQMARDAAFLAGAAGGRRARSDLFAPGLPHPALRDLRLSLPPADAGK